MTRPMSELPAGNGRLEAAFSAIIALLIFLLSYARIYYGISFTDEAYFIAIPWRFIHGDSPFQTELATLFGMFSFISYPFFKIFYLLRGSAEGIVLYARHLYFVFELLVAAGVFYFSRTFVRTPEALLVASCVIAFVPFNVQGLSYNTLACGFLTLGLFAGAQGVLANSILRLALSGWLLTYGAIVYLPLVPVAFLAFVLLVRTDRRAFLPFFVGTLLALCSLTPFLSYATWDAIRNNLDYTLSIGVQGGGWRKPLRVIWDTLHYLWPSILGSGFLVFLIQRKGDNLLRLIALLLLPIVLVVVNGMSAKPGSATYAYVGHGYVLGLALIGVWLYPFLNAEHKKLFMLVWVPSGLAAAIMGYSSSNGYINVGIGLLAGGICSLILLIALLTQKGEHQLVFPRWIGVAVPSLAACALVLYQYSSVYCDSALPRLTTEVASGPFKYIRTTPEKAAFIEDVAYWVRRVSAQSRSIIFYYDFPAGYLMTDMKPATNAIWLFQPSNYRNINTSMLSQYISATPPDIIFKFRHVFQVDKYDNQFNDDGYPIDVLANSGGYTIISDNVNFVIYQRN
ncbi:MAG: hypothetical protein ACR652_10510 [Methylocystis sp.]|uniref:hypothetical protein n=1 Tax=Methylocystis sp. TaxID=1911079 RepID=UPI003DA2C1DC